MDSTASARKLPGGRLGASAAARRRTSSSSPSVPIHTKRFVALTQKINQVPAETAARIQYSHPGCDATSQKLIEEVDVNFAELLLKIGHEHPDGMPSLKCVVGNARQQEVSQFHEAETALFEKLVAWRRTGSKPSATACSPSSSPSWCWS